MPRGWVAAVLGGCAYPTLQPEDLCAEVVHATALRTLECTGDNALANARGTAMADLECVASAVDEELWACPRAVYAAPCPEVEVLGDEVAYWLGRDLSCVRVLRSPSGGGSSMGLVPPYEGPLSCDMPPFVTLLGSANGFDEWFSAEIGDSIGFAPSCLPAVPTRDLALKIFWDDSGAPLALWSSTQDLPEVAATVLIDGDTCATARAQSCSLLPSSGAWVELAQGQGLGGTASALLVWSLMDPQAEGSVRIAVRPVGTGPPW